MLLLLLLCCVSTTQKSLSNPQKEVTTTIQKSPHINCNHSECSKNQQQPSRMSAYAPSSLEAYRRVPHKF